MFSFLVHPLFVFFFCVCRRRSHSFIHHFSNHCCLPFFTHSFLNNKMSYFREPGVLRVESPLIEGICACRLGSLWRPLQLDTSVAFLKC